MLNGFHSQVWIAPVRTESVSIFNGRNCFHYKQKNPRVINEAEITVEQFVYKDFRRLLLRSAVHPGLKSVEISQKSPRGYSLKLLVYK